MNCPSTRPRAEPHDTTKRMPKRIKATKEKERRPPRPVGIRWSKRVCSTRGTRGGHSKSGRFIASDLCCAIWRAQLGRFVCLIKRKHTCGGVKLKRCRSSDPEGCQVSDFKPRFFRVVVNGPVYISACISAWNGMEWHGMACRI